jgi:hypothetical protein
VDLSLGVRVLMGAIEALAKSKGFADVRVLPKVNARGELVLGVIIPPRTPREWGDSKERRP